MKTRQLDEHDQRIINHLNSAPRICGYRNTQLNEYDFRDFIRVYKGRVFLMFTISPENLTLEKLGYNDKWSKNRFVSEQFEIEITKEHVKQMIERLTRILNKLEK